jgi:hypothetical protein
MVKADNAGGLLAVNRASASGGSATAPSSRPT